MGLKNYLFIALLVFFPISIIASENNENDLQNRFFDDRNIVNVKVFYDDKQITNLNCYNYLGRYFLPVSRFISLLNGDFEVDYENQFVKIKLEEFKDDISINVKKNKLNFNGKYLDLPPNSIYIKDNIVYLDSDLIKNFTPIKIKAIPSEKKIDIYPADNLSNNYKDILQKILNKSRDKNLTQDLYNQVNESVANFEASKYLEGEKDISVLKRNNSEEYNDNDLVLGMTINKLSILEYIEGYSKNDKAFIPLKELVDILEFPISVNTKDKTASGWYLKQSNVLELNEGKVKTSHGEVKLDKDDIDFKNSDVYISSEKLSEIFDINFDVDLSTMLLNITSAEPFPFEDRLKRQNKYAIINAGKGKIEKEFKKIDTKYNMISTPITDVNLNYGYSSTLANKHTSSFSIVTSNDLADMTSNLFLAGDLFDQGISELRLRLGRASNERNLLGRLKATEFRFGDIESFSVPLVTTSNIGRGFKVSNRALTRPDQFDITNLIGDATPGWDAELYRNDTLLDFQTVGSDGKYQFLSVPILFGRNVFKIVLYGPQGQIVESYKEFNASTTILEKGDFTYNISADDKAETLFGISNLSKSNGSGFRGTSEFEYGITKWLTLASGLSHTVLGDGDHSYFSAGIRSGLGKFIGNIDNSCDIEKSGCASKLSLFSNLKGYDIRLQQAIYNNYISEEETNISDPKKSESIIDVNKDYILPVINQLSMGLTSRLTKQESGIDQNVAGLRLSKSIYGINISNLLEKNFGNTKKTDGSLAFRGNINKYLFGFTTNYNIEPQLDLSQLNLLIQKYINEKLVTRFNVTKDVSLSDNFDVSNTTTIDMGKYNLSFISSINNAGDYFLGVGINFSFSKLPGTDKWNFQNRPMSDNGSLISRAFVDKNYNNIKDENEDFIKSPSFKIGMGKTPKTDNDYYLSSNLAPYDPVKISYDEEEIKDPNLAPANDGYEIITRPGFIESINIPLYQASVIEGNLYLGKTSSTKSENQEETEFLDNPLDLLIMPDENDEDVEINSDTNEYSLEDALHDGEEKTVENNQPKDDQKNIEETNNENDGKNNNINDDAANEVTGNSGAKPAQYLFISLVNEEGKEVATTKTEFDGYFNFTRILPGKYRILFKDKNEKAYYSKQVLDIKNPDFYSFDDVYMDTSQ